MSVVTLEEEEELGDEERVMDWEVATASHRRASLILARMILSM